MDDSTACGCGFRTLVRQEPVAVLCAAVGLGWLGFLAWQRYERMRRDDPRRHPVTVRPDRVGVDPLDAPEHPVTGAMTPDEIEENAWSTAAPHVGSVETPPRPAG